MATCFRPVATCLNFTDLLAVDDFRAQFASSPHTFSRFELTIGIQRVMLSFACFEQFRYAVAFSLVFFADLINIL